MTYTKTSKGPKAKWSMPFRECPDCGTKTNSYSGTTWNSKDSRGMFHTFLCINDEARLDGLLVLAEDRWAPAAS